MKNLKRNSTMTYPSKRVHLWLCVCENPLSPKFGSIIIYVTNSSISKNQRWLRFIDWRCSDWNTFRFKFINIRQTGILLFISCWSLVFSGLPRTGYWVNGRRIFGNRIFWGSILRFRLTNWKLSTTPSCWTGLKNKVEDSWLFDWH